jgi:SPP1 family holin
MYELSKVRAASIARYVALVIVLVNAVLTMLGFPVLPEGSADVISSALVLVVGLYVGFRNNYLTKHGKAQAEALAAKQLLKK